MDAKTLSVETLVKHCSGEDGKQKITTLNDISDIETVKTKAASMGVATSRSFIVGAGAVGQDVRYEEGTRYSPWETVRERN